ncbi:MAG: DUF3488 domain-containing protein [Elusimicrobia bacterium]|nr:DUF3488 domain-containing protein [Elusimicrobiota bacterium]
MTALSLLLRRVVWTLAGVAVAALVLTRELDPLRTAVFPLLWIFLFVAEEKRRLPRADRIQTLIATALLLLTLARLLFRRDPFLLVIADFLVLFLLTKGAFVKDLKDLRQITALSFFVLLAAASLSLNISFLMAFLAYTVMASVTLALFTLAGLESRGEEANPRPMMPALVRTAGVTLFSAFVLSFLMFLLFPRWSAAVFQGTFLGPLRRSGYTESVNLQSAGEIYQDPRVVLRVETPAPWDGYLRGTTLTRFDGVRWTAEKGVPVLLRGPRLVVNRFTLPAPGPGPRAIRRQRIYLEAVDSGTLFAAPWPRRLEVSLPRIFAGEDRTLARPADHRGRLAYTVFSDPIPGTETASPELLEKSLALPSGNWDRVKAYAGRVVVKREPPAATAKRLTQRLQQDFTYSLEGAVTGENPVESFLFDVRRGHCEHFASALAVMLRLEGIPARIVTGFRAHERNLDGGYFVIRAQDAHAWVEAWVGNLWAPFDPTPVNRHAPAPPGLWRRWRERLDYVNFLWAVHVLGYDLESQKDMALGAWSTSQRIEGGLQSFRRQWNQGSRTGRIPGSALWIGALGGALVMTAAVLWGRRSLRKPAARHSKIKFYNDALRHLKRRGYPRAPAETPAEFQARLAAPPGSALGRLTALYHQVRFGAHTLTAEETVRVQDLLRTLRRSI